MKDLMEKIFQYLVPPGMGVYCPHEKIDSVKWHQHLKQDLPDNKNCCLLGVPCDTGGGILRGANQAPAFLRQHLKLTNKFFDLGDIRVIPQLLHDKYLNSSTITSCRQALYGKDQLPISPLSICQDFLQEFHRALPTNKLMIWGGDHSTSYPVLKAFLKAQKNKIAIIQFDAHTDLLEKRQGLDLTFGSWAAQIIRDETAPLLVQIGIRHSGQEQYYWEKNRQIKQFWAPQLHTQGPLIIGKQVIDWISQQGIETIYLDLDVDVFDPLYLPNTGTPGPSGLLPHQVMLILQLLKKNFRIGGANIVEYAPYLRPDGQLSSLLTLNPIIDFFIGCLND